MGSSSAAPAGPSGWSVALAMAGWLGLAACLVMVYLAMRAVMDIGGSCADGGPYVISRPCPEGSAPALFLGIFGGLFFAFVASVGGFGVGGVWAATPVLAWSALFGSLGWNFMDYGLFSAGEQGIEWGWAICGVVFWAMAIVPLIGLIPALRGEWLGVVPGRGSGGTGGSRGSGGSRGTDGSRAAPGGGRPGPSAPGPDVTVLTGPGQPARRQPARGPVVAGMTGEPTASAPGTAAAQHELARIAEDFGAVIGSAMAEVPLDPGLRGAPAPESPAGGAAAPEPGATPPEADFTEGTQALLDRLERLADMRDRGLLASEEYATAKATIMAELEGRS